MSKPAKRTTEAPYRPPIRFARLRAMMRALGSGKSLSAPARAEIVIALNLLYAKLAVESDHNTKGGREAGVTRGVALAMHWLIEHKGVTQKIAANTVLSAEFPNSTLKDAHTACRMYRAMRNAGELDPLMHKLDDTYMEKLAKRLPKPRSGKK